MSRFEAMTVVLFEFAASQSARAAYRNAGSGRYCEWRPPRRSRRRCRESKPYSSRARRRTERRIRPTPRRGPIPRARRSRRCVQYGRTRANALSAAAETIRRAIGIWAWARNAVQSGTGLNEKVAPSVRKAAGNGRLPSHQARNRRSTTISAAEPKRGILNTSRTAGRREGFQSPASFHMLPLSCYLLCQVPQQIVQFHLLRQ